MSFKYSVIIPAFNAQASIERCISSVFIQNPAPENVFVIDDGSVDATMEILVNLKTYYPIRIYKNELNIGAGKSRNKLINLVKTDLVAFLDADDFWYDNHIGELLNSLTKYDADIVTSGAHIFDQSQTLIGVRNPCSIIDHSELLAENLLVTSGTMLRTHLNGFRSYPNIRRRQDYAYLLHLIKENPNVKIAGTGVCTVHYNRSKGTVSANKFYNLYFNYKVFRQFYGSSIFLSILFVFRNILKRLKAD